MRCEGEGGEADKAVCASGGEEVGSGQATETGAVSQQDGNLNKAGRMLGSHSFNHPFPPLGKECSTWGLLSSCGDKISILEATGKEKQGLV